MSNFSMCMQSEFESWLQREKIGREPEEDTKWRRQYYDWYIRWEECDAGCDSLYGQSALSWGEYVDYDEDTSLEDGFDSVVLAMRRAMGPQVQILLGHVVECVDSSTRGGKVVLTCNGGEVTIEASRVIVTVSLGCLKERHRTMFKSPLPKRTVEAIGTMQEEAKL